MLNISCLQINYLLLSLIFINLMPIHSKVNIVINLTSITYIIIALLLNSCFALPEKYFVLSFIFSLLVFIIYSIDNLDKHKNKLIAGLISSLAAINILVTDNLWLILVYLELITLSSLVIIFSSPHKKSRKSGFLYLLTHLLASIVIITGIAMHGFEIDNIFNFDIDLITQIQSNGKLIIMVGLLVLIGLPPFSSWIIEAYSYINIRGMILIQSYGTIISFYLLTKIFHENKYLFYAGISISIYSFLLSLFETNIRKILNCSNLFQLGILIALTTYSQDKNYLEFIAIYVIAASFYKIIFSLVLRKISPLMEDKNIINIGNVYYKNPKLAILGLLASLGFIAFPGSLIYFVKTHLLASANLNSSYDIVNFLMYLPIFFVTWQYWLLFSKNKNEIIYIEFKKNEVLILIASILLLFIPGIYLLIDHDFYAMLKSFIALILLLLLYFFYNNLFKPHNWLEKTVTKNNVGLIKLKNSENLLFSKNIFKLINYIKKYKNLLIPYTISTNLLLCSLLLVILIIFVV